MFLPDTRHYASVAYVTDYCFTFHQDSTSYMWHHGTAKRDAWFYSISYHIINIFVKRHRQSYRGAWFVAIKFTKPKPSWLLCVEYSPRQTCEHQWTEMKQTSSSLIKWLYWLCYSVKWGRHRGLGLRLLIRYVYVYVNRQNWILGSLHHQSGNGCTIWRPVSLLMEDTLSKQYACIDQLILPWFCWTVCRKWLSLWKISSFIVILFTW